MYNLVCELEFNDVSSRETLEKGFWKAIQVYFERPNILNKRIFGSQFIEAAIVVKNDEDAIGSFLNHLNNQYHSRTASVNTLHELIQNQTYISIEDESKLDASSLFDEKKTIILLRKLLPRMKPPFNEENELIFINRESKSCVFYPLSTADLRNRLTPDLSYKFTLHLGTTSSIALEAASLSSIISINSDKPSIEWLKTNVFPKITKWARQENPEENVSEPPLHLVEIENYNNLRLMLREKYADYFIKIWPDDGTDPLKFVHEDIAIAAYLISLWECERKVNKTSEKQSFVDLGCGNGLLVHILSSEGYPGIGVDLRKRQLWDILGCGTSLKEMTIVPSSHSLFPEYDWLIGNHSDELTPWIPVIAARSSYNMRVFLLPCCPFTFNGKFERRQGGFSQYQSYLSFVENLCNVIGFNVERDKLRIPSTKRTCFVCSSRNYPQLNEAEIDEIRSKFIETNSKVVKKSLESKDGNGNWSGSFVPRDKAPAVANCTQLDKNFLENVVGTIANKLLSLGEEYHEIETNSSIKKLKYGGSISLGDLAESLDSEIKIQLKQQNGGLQTLIRNHRHIFEIKNGQIFITKPLVIKKSDSATKVSKNNKKPIALRSRTCWFMKNHPQGCPLSDGECRYSHECN